MENKIKRLYLYEGSIVTWSRAATMMFFLGIDHEKVYGRRHHHRYSKTKAEKMKAKFKMYVDMYLIEEAEETAVTHLSKISPDDAETNSYFVIIDADTGDSQNDEAYNALKREAFMDLRLLAYHRFEFDDNNESMETCIARVNAYKKKRRKPLFRYR